MFGKHVYGRQNIQFGRRRIVSSNYMYKVQTL